MITTTDKLNNQLVFNWISNIVNQSLPLNDIGRTRKKVPRRVRKDVYIKTKARLKREFPNMHLKWKINDWGHAIFLSAATFTITVSPIPFDGPITVYACKECTKVTPYDLLTSGRCEDCHKFCPDDCGGCSCHLGGAPCNHCTSHVNDD